MKATEADGDWWWIDFLENDLDPSTLPDIEYLLTHSESDQAEFERWRSLRQWVRESDPVSRNKELWSASELSAQKNKIMSAVFEPVSKTLDKAGEIALRLV